MRSVPASVSLFHGPAGNSLLARIQASRSRRTPMRDGESNISRVIRIPTLLGWVKRETVDAFESGPLIVAASVRFCELSFRIRNLKCFEPVVLSREYSTNLSQHQTGVPPTGGVEWCLLPLARHQTVSPFPRDSAVTISPYPSSNSCFRGAHNRGISSRAPQLRSPCPWFHIQGRTSCSTWSAMRGRSLSLAGRGYRQQAPQVPSHPQAEPCHGPICPFSPNPTPSR